MTNHIVKIAAVSALTLTLFATGAQADGNPATGKQVFKSNCRLCHTVKPGKKKIGPSLFGIYGQASVGMKGYTYSSAMKKAKLTWDDATLDEYLKALRKKVKGTKMTFAGLKKRRTAPISSLISRL